MTTPSIQNDLSYYRRIMSRQSQLQGIGDCHDVPKDADGYEPITSDLASLMSMFYAQPTPMLKVLSEATTSFVSTVSSEIVGFQFNSKLSPFSFAEKGY